MNYDLDFINFISSDDFENFKIRLDKETCIYVTNNMLQYYLNLDKIMNDYDVLAYREYKNKINILRGWVPGDYDPVDGFFNPEGEYIFNYIHHLEELAKELEKESKVNDYISIYNKMRKFIILRIEEKENQRFIPYYIIKRIFFDTQNRDLFNGISMCFMIGEFFSKKMEAKGIPTAIDITSAKYELITLFRHLKQNCNSVLFKHYNLLDLDYEKDFDFYTYCYVAGKLKYSYEELEERLEQRLKEQREIEAIREEYMSKSKFSYEDYIDEEEEIMDALENGEGEIYGF